MKPIKNIMTVDRVANEVERYGEKELKYWKKYDFFETSDGLKVLLTPARATSLDTTIWKSDEDEHGNYVTSDYYAPNEDAKKTLFIKKNLGKLTEISDHAYLAIRSEINIRVGTTRRACGVADNGRGCEAGSPSALALGSSQV